MSTRSPTRLPLPAPARAPATPPRRRRPAHDRRALACLVLGLLVLGAGLASTLSHSSERRTGTNGVWAKFALAGLGPGQRACQGGELVPAGTTALMLVLQPMQAVGPGIDVTLRRAGSTLQRTSLLVSARKGVFATVPIAPPRRDLDRVEVCLDVRTTGSVALIGDATPPGTGSLRVRGQLTSTSIPITYMRGGARSWWQHAGTVADRMALGRGDWGGPWVVWAIGALLLASLALVAATLLRAVIADGAGRAAEAGRRIPKLAWAVAAVAMLNAVAWSLITPAFQVPDEQTHIGYAQQLAEVQRPPIDRRGNERIAPELSAAMRGARFGSREVRTIGATVWSPLQERRLAHDLHAPLARHGNDAVGPAAPEPPLYYALEAIPYKLASGATLLDRVAAMRLLSAAMAGATALFVLLFLRECLPSRPWALAVGALGAALSPVLGFVSGGVNPDALLFAICAALFYLLAAAFRRGLTTRRAAWIGAIVAAGIVGKINFYGLVPGALLAVVWAARASAGGINRRSLRLVGIAVGVAVAPYLLLSALDSLLWDRSFILAHTPAELPEDHGGLGGQLSYLWQLFLPRLPGQTTAFPEMYPGYQLWLRGFIGRFGWVVVAFPGWVYQLGAAVLGVLVLLALRTAALQRAALRGRRAELVGYAAMAGGLLLLIALVALRGWAPGIAGAIQGRYLLPLLALFGGLLVLAARGAGERWGRTVGVALVLLCVAWSLFGQLVTIAFFYS